jgi:hypothetical protein
MPSARLRLLSQHDCGYYGVISRAAVGEDSGFSYIEGHSGMYLRPCRQDNQTIQIKDDLVEPYKYVLVACWITLLIRPDPTL